MEVIKGVPKTDSFRFQKRQKDRNLLLNCKVHNINSFSWITNSNIMHQLGQIKMVVQLCICSVAPSSWGMYQNPSSCRKHGRGPANMMQDQDNLHADKSLLTNTLAHTHHNFVLSTERKRCYDFFCY